MTNRRAETAPLMRLSWDSADHHRELTWAGITGLGAAVGMAILGLPPVNLHGPLHYLGIMDPLCGGTRAARYTVRGEFTLAWTYNPLGILATVAAALTSGRALLGLITQQWLNYTLTWTPWRRRVVTTIILIALILLEVRQQLRADLLIATA